MPVPCKAAVKRHCRKRPMCRSAYFRPNNRSPIGREAAPCNKFLPSKPTKTFPESTRTKQSESNNRHARAGALGGSSGRMREVWREKETPPKGVSFSLQGLPPPTHQTFIGRSRVRSWIASAMCGARITSLESRSAIVRATRRMRPYPRALNPMRSYAARSRADASSST